MKSSFFHGIRSKFVLLLLLFSFSPLALLGVITYYVSSGVVTKELNESSLRTLEKLSMSLESQIQRATDFIYSNTGDSGIIQALRQEDPPLADLAGPKIRQILSQNIGKLDFSVSVFIMDAERNLYSSRKLSNEDRLLVAGRILTQDWYQKLWNRDNLVHIIGVRDNYSNQPEVSKVFYLYANIIQDGDYLGTVIVGIDEYLFSRQLKNTKISEDGEIFLMDGDYRIILSEEGREVNPGILNAGFLGGCFKTQSGFYPVNILGKSELATFYPVRLQQWKIVMLTPTNRIYEKLSVIKKAVIGFSVLSFLSIILLIFIIDTSITSPIIYLSRLMKEVRGGNLAVRMKKNSHDEIGVLANGFNSMLMEFDKLLERIRQDEQMKKKLEFSILQEQMKPHFLYNTLNAIRWMAELQKADNIGYAVVALGRLIEYNAGNSGPVVTVREEVKYLDDYLHLYSLRYLDNFQYSFEIDKEVCECSIVKLLLQPLVENAVIHGFKDRKYGGLLKITSYAEKGRLVFEISDNGVGMNLEKLQEIQTERVLIPGKTHGNIGIFNVKERIRLHYGEDFGLRFARNSAGGITVHVNLPLECGTDRDGQEAVLP